MSQHLNLLKSIPEASARYRWVLTFAIHSQLAGTTFQNVVLESESVEGDPSPLLWDYIPVAAMNLNNRTGVALESITFMNATGPMLVTGQGEQSTVTLH